MEDFTSISLPDISATKIPMAYPSLKNKLPTSGIFLAGDLGGTKTDLALFEIQKGKLVAIKNQRFKTTDHQSFINAIKTFHGDELSTINVVCFGVAGVIIDDKVKGVNFGWDVDARKLESDLNIKKVLLINDLQANAYGLSALAHSDFETLIENKSAQGNAAIISPGTGLGEAGMYWDGYHYHPYATEGGHCNFAPTDELDFKLWEYLNSKFGHVSWERVLSGQGIRNIYHFLLKYRNVEQPEWLTKEFEKEDEPIAISKAALANKDQVSVETLQLFLKYLAVESAQLALKAKATGGIYIGGGIAPKILQLIDKEDFLKNFINFGRMEDLLKTIPVKIVLNDKTALMGAAYCAAMAHYK